MTTLEYILAALLFSWLGWMPEPAEPLLLASAEGQPIEARPPPSPAPRPASRKKKKKKGAEDPAAAEAVDIRSRPGPPPAPSPLAPSPSAAPPDPRPGLGTSASITVPVEPVGEVGAERSPPPTEPSPETPKAIPPPAALPGPSVRPEPDSPPGHHEPDGHKVVEPAAPEPEARPAEPTPPVETGVIAPPPTYVPPAEPPVAATEPPPSPASGPPAPAFDPRLSGTWTTEFRSAQGTWQWTMRVAPDGAYLWSSAGPVPLPPESGRFVTTSPKFRRTSSDGRVDEGTYRLDGDSLELTTPSWTQIWKRAQP